MKRVMKSIENFRELGGIKTTTGKSVKHGYFFRCGALHKPSKKDKKYFESLNISKVFDFRDKAEADDKPDFEGNFEYILAPALKSTLNELAIPKEQKEFFKNLTEEQCEMACKIFLQSYALMPFENDAYNQLLQSLNNFKPILFHCASGKDRTGLGGAFILLSLGVDRDTVMENYLLSNLYRKWDNKKFFIKIKLFVRNKNAERLLDYIVHVREEFLNASLDAIFEKYTTFDNYLLEEYGITKEMTDKWKEFYLE